MLGDYCTNVLAHISRVHFPGIRETWRKSLGDVTLLYKENNYPGNEIIYSNRAAALSQLLCFCVLEA